MRSAGCVMNDILDRKIDQMVERTKNRPIACGQISVKQGLILVLALCLAAFIILIQFNLNTIILGLASMPFAFTYPLMKRFTYWPQLFLGITFNYGLILGWTAINNQISIIPIIFYLGAVFWTLGYDTIYAHQDREDDELVGVKSSALKLGENTRIAVLIFYAASLACLALAGARGGVGLLFWAGLAIASWQLAMQVYRLDIDDPARCLQIFKSNRDAGFIIAGAFILGIF